jgi:hypothetical protein
MKRRLISVKHPPPEPRSGVPNEMIGIFLDIDPDLFRAVLVTKGFIYRIGKWSTYFWGAHWPVRGRLTQSGKGFLLRFPKGFGLTIADLVNEHNTLKKEKNHG